MFAADFHFGPIHRGIGAILRKETQHESLVFQEIAVMSTPALQEMEITIAADDFSALEQRVLRTVELLKSEREAKAAVEERIREAEQRIAETDQRVQTLEASVQSLEETGLNAEQRIVTLEDQLSESEQKVAQLNDENAAAHSQIEALGGERDNIRGRVEKLLKHLDDITA